jgi:hypothetical protein
MVFEIAVSIMLYIKILYGVVITLLYMAAGVVFYGIIVPISLLVAYVLLAIFGKKT